MSWFIAKAREWLKQAAFRTGCLWNSLGTAKQPINYHVLPQRLFLPSRAYRQGAKLVFLHPNLLLYSYLKQQRWWITKSDEIMIIACAISGAVPNLKTHIFGPHEMFSLIVYTEEVYRFKSRRVPELYPWAFWEIQDGGHKSKFSASEEDMKVILVSVYMFWGQRI